MDDTVRAEPFDFGMPHSPLEAPFLTGSRAYGEPDSKSDLDLVVMFPRGVVELLRPLATEGSDPPGSVSLKFFRLNLICVTSRKSWDVWRQGTADLVARKPVTRKLAVAHFVMLRKAAGIT